ncbi:MAG: energy transducer TonB [Steroidobacteraceae bacterium]
MQTLTATRGPLWPSFAMAFFVSLTFFWLMYTVISRSGHGVEKRESLPTIDFVRLKRDSEVETTQRRKPPPPPEQPPPPQKLQVSTAAVSADAVAMDVPTLGLNAQVGGGPFVGEMGGGGGMGGLFDGDIIPIQRVPPAYPRDAARAGVTGFVQLEVMVNADGSVRSVKVIESKPKGLFEAAAVAAVMRWKFKPKVVNGQPVAQRGSQKIDFNLNQPAAS